MKVAYKDLTNFLSEIPSKELLSDKLFQLGHEHEIHGDIFEMELTPNRGDCFSLMGLARDLNVFFGNSKALHIYEDDIEVLEIDFENSSPKDCPKISFLEIEIDDEKTKYQPYLENFFNSIGGNTTNLFTDISNYISYELGQPTHCFDRETIKEKIVFENKFCDSKFKTLLGTEINLQDNNCIFSMDGEIISLAGVMGGASTACSKKTKKVLVECAYFNPESIIGKSIKYNLTSDAAHKFERGVDIAAQEMVLRRFAKVVQDHSRIKSIKLKSFIEHDTENISIPIDVKKINKILGTDIKENEYLGILKKLGFDISNEIKVPSYRHDIRTNNDLSEEIARVVGYNNIESISLDLKKIINDKNHSNQARIRSFLTENGFSEVINFPFASKKENDSISIDNPLDSNRNNFRTSLQDSLIKNLLYNERRQKDSLKLFEISDIYTKDKRLKQQKKLGIIISGRLGNNYRDFTKKLDYKYLNELLNKDSNIDLFDIIEIPRNALDTKKKDKIFFVEIPLENIPSSFYKDIEIDRKTEFTTIEPVSEFPSSTRDFSFSINNLSNVNIVISMLDGVSDKLIKNSFIFDFYQNDELNTVKLGYRFIFQSNQKTLSDEDINKKVSEILEPILKLEGVSIPGM
tara:strand:- start:6806 stop:8704 length:1899 start_codon:yes stop_codon:yes gene_type:complete